MLVIAVACAILWYSIRLVQLVFKGIESERIRVRGFYPEWATPTFNLVKMLMVVFAIVVERSLLVTRIRTPKNVEVAIPNAKVMGDHIVNFNAQVKKKGLIHHTTLSIGYDVDWRKVRDLLMVAAGKVEGVAQKPVPFVRQLELGDFSVVYELNVTIHQPHMLPRITSDLHANILDAFNGAGVEIMSPEFAALRDGNAVTIPGVSGGNTEIVANE